MSTTHKTHATRDHRFAYISTGDLTRWCKGTSHPVYPEPSNRNVGPIKPATDAEVGLKTVKKAARKARDLGTVMVGQSSTDKTVKQEMESCEKRAKIVDRSLEISNIINKRFGLL